MKLNKDISYHCYYPSYLPFCMRSGWYPGKWWDGFGTG